MKMHEEYLGKTQKHGVENIEERRFSFAKWL